MPLTPAMIDQTLIDLFAQHDVTASRPISLEHLERLWAGTGLRRGDLLQALRRMELDGLVFTEMSGTALNAQLTLDGRQRVLGYGEGPGLLSVLLLRWSRERFVRRRRRSPAGAPIGQRSTDLAGGSVAPARGPLHADGS